MVIHSLDHIKERLTFIQDVLQSHYDGSEGNILMTRLTDISAYMAEAGKLKSDAEYHLHEKMQSEVLKAIKNLLPEYTSATVQNALIKSLCGDLQSLVTFADRVNRSCTHQLEVMRTQLSYLKSMPQ